MVARAEGVIIQHYFKVGALPILKETYPDQVKYRFLLPPEVFDRWAGKFCKCPAPLPPCQHPTHPAKAAHIES